MHGRLRYKTKVLTPSAYALIGASNGPIEIMTGYKWTKVRRTIVRAFHSSRRAVLVSEFRLFVYWSAGVVNS